MTREDKNSGSLLSQDEKKGVERLIEGMQLVPWSSMERATRPAATLTQVQAQIQPQVQPQAQAAGQIQT